jgi:hypothetical protein
MNTEATPQGLAVDRSGRPHLPEREAAAVYAELRAMGYTWHQAHETMDRIAAEGLTTRVRRAQQRAPLMEKHDDRTRCCDSP